MIYRFIDALGTFSLKNPLRHNFYFPLTDASGRLLSSIAPNLSGDIKKDNEHFLTLPASIEDLRSSPLCRREFFIKTGKKVIRLSRPYQDRLEAGFLYQKVYKKVSGLEIEILSFIPYDLPVEVMRIKIKNVSSGEIKILPTSFLPLYGRAEKNLRDHRHVSSLLNRTRLNKFGIFLKPAMVFDEKGHKFNQTVYFVLGYEGKTRAPQGQFPSLDSFFGEGDIFSPDAVFKNILPPGNQQKECGGKEVCAAFRFREKKLNPGAAAEYVLVLGIEEKESCINGYFTGLNSPAKVEQALKETKKYWQGYLANLELDFKDINKNSWLDWVKFQPTLRKLFGCSFLPHFDYGKGGRGWRDLWQDALTLLLIEPVKARKIITASFAGVRLDGSNAAIIANDGSFLADRNRINRVWMDHGVWPFLTTRHYLNRTGDLNLLLENQTYFRDHQLKRAKLVDADFCQKDFLQRDKNNRIYQGSILEHILIQTLVQFFNVGAHNIIKLENADWNDGLDMAADKGESAAFSFMYAHNLKSLADILRILKNRQNSARLLKEAFLLLDTLRVPINYNDYQAKQKLLDKYFEQSREISGTKIEIKLADLIADLEAKYLHMFKLLSAQEWLKEGFFNGYYDNRGCQVEGKRGNAVRMMLTSQVFALMSGVASDEQARQIWRSIKKYLEDKKFGGFHLNTNLERPDLNLGRAFGFSYGDKENGAFFSHMNIMLANALYQRGFVREGKEVMDSIYAMATAQEAEIPPVLPEYFNSQGRGLYLYLTGSASWYIYTLVEEVLGVKFSLGDILLEPKLLPDDFTADTISLRWRLKAKTINLVYRRKDNPRRPYRIESVYLGEKKILSEPRRCFLKSSWFTAQENHIRVKLC